MKRFTIPCDFGGKKAPFDVYIGLPSSGAHPLQYQSLWLEEQRGGKVPTEVMESFGKLLALSNKNGVSFEDLCVYALEAANEEKNKKGISQNGKEIIENEKMKTASELKVLADAEQLRHAFDADFNLLFIVAKRQNTEYGHLVLLTPADNTVQIKKLIHNEKTVLERLGAFGQVEHYGKGVALDKVVVQRLRAKYSSTSE